MMNKRITKFGFVMGPLEVIRSMVLPDERPVVTVKTPYRELDIYCSKTGRSLRVFEKGVGELTLVESRPAVTNRGAEG